MRALSLNERSDAPLPQVVGQAAHAVLKELNDHQLSFEELTKDPELDHLFRCATEVKGHLAKVATYLQERVVRPWEMAGEALLAKGDRQPLSELGPFVSFAKDSDSDFVSKVTLPVKAAQSGVLPEVFGGRGAARTE